MGIQNLSRDLGSFRNIELGLEGVEGLSWARADLQSEVRARSDQTQGERREAVETTRGGRFG